jgi:phosphoglycolate phosphatase
MMNMIEGILFDLDGTLLNTIGDIAESMNAVLRKHGFPEFQDDEYKLKVGWGMRGLVERSLPAGSDTECIDTCEEELMELYHKVPIARTKPYPGIEELLNNIEKVKIPMSILSNKADSLTQKVVKALLRQWNFIYISGAKDGVPRKPDPTLAVEAAKAMNISPSAVALLGDSAIDINTAQNAGMVPIGASWGFRPEKELQDAGAERVVHDPAAFFHFIKENSSVHV